MSYSPKHGGNNQANRSASADYASNEKTTETKSKSVKRLIAVILLIVFLAGIVVAAIFAGAIAANASMSVFEDLNRRTGLDGTDYWARGDRPCLTG